MNISPEEFLVVHFIPTLLSRLPEGTSALYRPHLPPYEWVLEVRDKDGNLDGYHIDLLEGGWTRYVEF
ncbi:hypothetical protein D3C80_882270 [compost metagenome]